MARKSCIFTVGLAVSITLSLIPITARLSAAQQQNEKTKPAEHATGGQAPAKEAPVIPPPDPSPYTGEETRKYNQDALHVQHDMESLTRQMADDTHNLSAYTHRLVWIGGAVGFLEILLLFFQALYTGKAARATNRQSEVMRHQLVGTLGAILHPRIEASEGLVTVQFGNEGKVAATDVRGTVKITRVVVPALTPIEPTQIHPFEFSTFRGDPDEGLQYRLDPRWFPFSPRKDNWDSFANDPRTIKIEVNFTYKNGFGDDTTGRSLCLVYLARWEVKTKRGGSGGGGFLPCDSVAIAWDDITSRKHDEANGIYRE